MYQEKFRCVKSKTIVGFDQILVDDVEDPWYQVTAESRIDNAIDK